jgi:hypothetical protein
VEEEDGAETNGMEEENGNENEDEDEDGNGNGNLVQVTFRNLPKTIKNFQNLPQTGLPSRLRSGMVLACPLRRAPTDHIDPLLIRPDPPDVHLPFCLLPP